MIVRLLASAGLMTLMCAGCLPPPQGTEHPGVSTMMVVNAATVPVCEINLWRDGERRPDETQPDYNWLHGEGDRIGPGAKHALGVKPDTAKYHLRAKTCSGSVLFENASLDVSKSQEILVH